MKKEPSEFYRKFYDIKKLNIDISTQNIVFLIYDDKYYYYLSKDKLVESNTCFNILGVVKKLKREYKLDIINYYPVCFCKKTLVMAFRIISNDHTYLQKIDFDKIPLKYKKVIEYHRKKFEMSYISTNVNKEIEMSQKYIRRYKFHKKYIKKYILTNKRRKKEEFKKLIENFIPNLKSIIDISCGDNSDIFEIANNKKYETIVGNDICINYLNNKTLKDVIYTNDDIEFNNIKRHSYDVAFCKNTLHHMNNLTNIKNMLSFLDDITSNEILIVEICNPKEEGGLPKFLNKWLYVKFLKDVGDCFLNETQFKQIINQSYSSYNVKFEKFTNILGSYMIAIVKKGE